MTNYYENVPLQEFEGILANREYWDNASYEWENFSKMEVKLARLGTFVQRGGDLNQVIFHYAEGREYTYRVMAQHCLERYIEALTDKRIKDITLRIYKLEKEEAVKLLAELLKASVNKTCEYDKYKKRLLFHTRSRLQEYRRRGYPLEHRGRTSPSASQRNQGRDQREGNVLDSGELVVKKKHVILC